MAKSRLENEVDKLLDRVFTVEMLLHPEKLEDAVEMQPQMMTSTAEHKGDHFKETEGRARCMIMHFKLLKAQEMAMAGGSGGDGARKRSELRQMEGEIQSKLDDMNKWLKKETKGRKKSKYPLEELQTRSLTYKSLKRKFRKSSAPTNDIDAPTASVEEFLNSPGSSSVGADGFPKPPRVPGDDDDASDSEEEEEMTLEHEAALKFKEAEEEKQEAILLKIEQVLKDITQKGEEIGNTVADQEDVYKMALERLQSANDQILVVNENLEKANEDAQKDHPELICVCICCVGILLGLAIVGYKLLVSYIENSKSSDK